MDGFAANTAFDNVSIPQYKRVSLKNQKALIAMSNRQLAMTVYDFLQELQVGEFYITSSCTDAVQLIDTYNFDLCYVGYALPQMGGPDFVRFIRTAETRTSRALVTMLMPNPTARRIREARNAGVHEILGLPLTKKLLGERMLAMLTTPKPWVQTHGYTGPCRRRDKAVVYHGEERRMDAGSQYADRFTTA